MYRLTLSLLLFLFSFLVVVALPEAGYAARDKCPEFRLTDFTWYKNGFTEPPMKPALGTVVINPNDPNYDASHPWNIYQRELEKEAFSKNCKQNSRNVQPYEEGPWIDMVTVGPNNELVYKEPPLWPTGPLYIADRSCDVYAPPIEHPSYPGYYISEDCFVKGVDVTNFRVQIKYDVRRLSQYQNVDCGGIEGVVCWPNMSRWMGHGDRYTHVFTASVFQAEMENDRLCVYAYRIGIIPKFVQCAALPSPPPAPMPNQACWVSDSCRTDDALASQWVLPFTSVVVQCVQDTVKGLFVNPTLKCGTDRKTMFQVVQDNFRTTVSLVLVMYMIFLGIKTVFGKFASQKDAVEAIVKVALVLYFAVEEGWIEYFPRVLDAGAHLADIVFRGSAMQYDYCVFDANNYPGGFQYISVWDSLDCKLYYYLGFRANQPVPKLVLMALANFWGFGIFILFLGILFAVMLLLISIYALRVYIFAIMAITILVYISPMIIPLVLFQVTKPYFDKWLNELVGYVLYPLILFAFLALVFGVFDKIYWGDAFMSNFNPQTAELTIDCSPTLFGQTSPTIVNSPGCAIERGSVAEMIIPVLNISYNTAQNFAGGEVLLAVLKGCFFAFLFTYFLMGLPSMMSALTNTLRTSNAMPDVKDLKNQISGSVGGTAKASGGFLGNALANKVNEKRKGGDKDGGGQKRKDGSQSEALKAEGEDQQLEEDGRDL